MKFKVLFEGNFYQLKKISFNKEDKIRGVQFRIEGGCLRYLRMDSGLINLYMTVNENDWIEV